MTEARETSLQAIWKILCKILPSCWVCLYILYDGALYRPNSKYDFASLKSYCRQNWKQEYNANNS